MNRIYTGMSHTPTYRSWKAMMARCYSPNVYGFANYGGRGIKVCRDWHGFLTFLADMGERPAGTSLDRIDNDGNYNPSNCRWATAKEQNNNKKSNVHLTLNGETLPALQWAAKLGMKYATLMKRREDGWTDEEILSRPVRPRGPNVNREIEYGIRAAGGL